MAHDLPPACPALPPVSQRSAGSAPLWPLIVLAVITALPELVILGADAGLWGQRWWRVLAYQYGGFWAGLWHGWQPNYAAQPWTMILTYSVLHAGPGHLAGNLAAFGMIAVPLRRQIGNGGVLALWLAGAVGGGVVFGLLASSAAPMVGASGAVFGLAGGWWWLDLAARPPRRRRWLRAAGIAVAAILGNAAMFALSPAGIAWETHLGGALAGAALAALWWGKWKRAAP